jgi:hypothetical protein
MVARITNGQQLREDVEAFAGEPRVTSPPPSPTNNAELLARLAQASRRITECEAKVKESEIELHDRRAVLGRANKDLRDLLTALAAPCPLFDGIDVGSPAEAKSVPWELMGLREILEGLPGRILEKLNQAGVFTAGGLERLGTHCHGVAPADFQRAKRRLAAAKSDFEARRNADHH